MMIQLREVTNDNFRVVYKLSDTLTDYQKGCVAPNVVSLAQAYLNLDQAWPRAIYLDETPIGFLMLSIPAEEVDEADKPAVYLWRFMIAHDYQRQGYGSQALDFVVQKCKEEGYRFLYASCHIDGPQPYDFYMKYGFVDTGKMEEGEEIIKLDLSTK